MFKYGPNSYFQLGRVYPRDALRLPYPRPKRRLLVAAQNTASAPLIIVTVSGAGVMNPLTITMGVMGNITVTSGVG